MAQNYLGYAEVFLLGADPGADTTIVVNGK